MDKHLDLLCKLVEDDRRATSGLESTTARARAGVDACPSAQPVTTPRSVPSVLSPKKCGQHNDCGSRA